MKKLLLFAMILLLMAAVCGAALGDVEINESNFPDTFFRDYISDTFDPDEDGILTDEDCSAVTSIWCENLGIVSVKGIEFFPNLEYLALPRNQIEKIDVSHNRKLIDLGVDQNRLTALDVTKNVNLESLHCEQNQITSLDVSKNKKLRIFYPYTNRLKELDLSGNPELVEANCWNNRLTKLNIKKNRKLERLYLSTNCLSSLDVSGNPKLYELGADSNPLIKLDISKCPKLVTAVKKSSNDNQWDILEYRYGNYVVSVNSNVFFSVDGKSFTMRQRDGKFSLKGSKVTYLGPVNKSADQISIPNTVSTGSKTYEVKAIAAGACKGMKNLTNLTIGKYVEEIGAGAFQSCGKLREITLRTKKLKAKMVGSNAFKSIYSKPTVTCPKGMAKTYKKLLLKKGMPKKAVFQ